MSERAQGVRVDLADDELHMLVLGLTDWGVKEAATERLAAAMGFASIADLLRRAVVSPKPWRLVRPLSVRDWTRALVATEIAFASEVFGTGREWTVIQGGSDSQWMVALRKLQGKVPVGRRFLDPRADLRRSAASTRLSRCDGQEAAGGHSVQTERSWTSSARRLPSEPSPRRNRGQPKVMPSAPTRLARRSDLREAAICW
ncbi:MAG: hypothetical protein WKF76_11990 [Nocardioidaceae bacterium]